MIRTLKEWDEPCHECHGTGSMERRSKWLDEPDDKSVFTSLYRWLVVGQFEVVG